MKLSTRGRYGTRALLDLALHSGKEPVQLRDIAGREGVSLQYLQHLVTLLVGAGMVRSIRGPKGGVLLNRDPAEIKLGEVIKLLEGSASPVECITDPEACHRFRLCVIRDIWCEVKEAMDRVLESTTLQDLIERQREKQQPEPEMYYI